MTTTKKDPCHSLSTTAVTHLLTPYPTAGLGVAHLQQGQYEEADKAFLQALKEDPSPSKDNADTLINLLATAQHLHKPPETVHKLLACVAWRGVACGGGLWPLRTSVLPCTHSTVRPDSHSIHDSQLQKSAPSHPYVTTLSTLDAAFDRLQQQYASHVVTPSSSSS
jgi:tetratricopeptide (TPR) repeat protein